MASFTIPIRSDKLQMSFSVVRELCNVQTDFQKVTVLETEVFGKALLLDGHIQLTDFDEAAYHECLVQIPALNLPKFEKALVIGGGDGGVIREICRHASVSQIDMVEIDQGVVDACRQWMPNLSDGAFDDSRVNLQITDAFPFVKQATGPYDLIVVDSTDTYEEEEGEISEMLWTKEFYTDLSRLLAPSGIVVTQADNHVFCPYSCEEVLDLFGGVFAQKGFYFGLVPSFGGFSGFAWGSNDRSLAAELSVPAGYGYLNDLTYQLAFSELSFSR
ncbi:MAG: polyamine aminopropyltransferase [Armatimonadetes bacterium]|nr:polyamine aminopropyltransferase [Armatimonadota bacterium]